MSFINRSTLSYPATSTLPVQTWLDDRNPTSADFRNFEIGNVWINNINSTAWIMVGKTSSAGTWIQAAATGTGILTETGNSGGAVGPDGANNINVVGTTPMSVVGNPGTNTLTVTAAGSVPTSFAADLGTATPSGHILNVNGTGGIATTGVGGTLFINAGSTIPTTFTEDAGTATPSGNNLNIVGAGGITTSGAADTVTITAGVTIPTTFTEDTGSATPAANNINIIGGVGVTTSGAGSTVTINASGGGLTWLEVVVVGPTAMTVDKGYVANNGGRVQLTLPLTSAFGSNIRVLGKGAGGWQINQNAGQSIVLDSSTTTVGVGGTLQSDAFRDSVDLVCTTTDTVWTIADGIGNYIFT